MTNEELIRIIKKPKYSTESLWNRLQETYGLDINAMHEMTYESDSGHRECFETLPLYSNYIPFQNLLDYQNEVTINFQMISDSEEDLICRVRFVVDTPNGTDNEVGWSVIAEKNIITDEQADEYISTFLSYYSQAVGVAAELTQELIAQIPGNFAAVKRAESRFYEIK